MPSSAPRLYTIGHSTRTFDEFLAILQADKIKMLVDVRTVPRSRRVPQFNTENLSESLPRHHIQYLHLPSLGGLRIARPDSANTGWRNDSFRGYADYMQTAEFESGLKELISVAKKQPTSIMCAEAVPWRCHRSLIADAMLVRGWQVIDLFSETSAKPHKLTDFAKVEGTHVTYPSPQPLLFTAASASQKSTGR
ncbi:MAG TPA: DUF488 domain-containing protein [Tepidisphaeraceae bacterium]|jgi:uncharacterized protein (DUF488 family)|nr:DUF488 domain-containing protein [Tepidisphaeraceae bacterium]